MMKHEFEKIARRTVTDRQYEAIEALYMDSDLDKYVFVKSIKGMLKSIPEVEPERQIVRVTVTDNSGYEYTPNGCWLHTIKAEVVDIEISTGKIVLRKIEGSYQLGTWCEYHYWDERIKWVD